MDAYEFVRLHQPAAYYGVNSRPLETNQATNEIFKTEIREDKGHMQVLNISQTGGGADLASKAQILAYSYLIFVTATTGAARVKISVRCKFF